MAPTYCVVKLFQKATQKGLKRKNVAEENESVPKLAKETDETNRTCNDILADKCRICLNSGTIPIFASDGSSDMLEAIRTFGAIPLRADDDYPKQICDPCFGLLQNAILFRETAKKSHKFLTTSIKFEPRTPVKLEVSTTPVEVARKTAPVKFEILTTPVKIEIEENCSNTYSGSTQSVQKPNANYSSTRSVQKSKANFSCTESVQKVKNFGSKLVQKSKTENSILSKYFDHVETKEDGEIVKIKPHEKDLLQMPKLQCRICLKVICKSSHRDHYSSHVKTINHVCEVCGKGFRLRSAYQTHISTHSTEFPYKCKFCPYKGRHSGLLSTHMKVHTKDYKHKCMLCPAKFLTKGNLNKHSLKHKEPEIPCSSCKRKFHTQSLVDKHFEVEHLGVKKHVCDICGKAFGFREGMMRHQLDVHKREKKIMGRTPSYLEVECQSKESSGKID